MAIGFSQKYLKSSAVIRIISLDSYGLDINEVYGSEIFNAVHGTTVVIT